jgi:SAM-dependent methyltransferase
VDPQTISDLQSSYDAVAEEYVRRIFDELKDKPLDRELLDRFAADVRGKGAVCDVGCGPGQVARYLAERNVNVIGVDLSPEMTRQARRLNPNVEFRQGNMLALEAEDGAWAGITVFYSLIHIPREEVVSALREFARVLRPAGLLLLAFHVGEEVIHLDEWWRRQVSVDFIFFRPEEMTSYLQAAGFEVEAVIERPPYENVEHPSRRAYIFARKPA